MHDGMSRDVKERIDECFARNQAEWNCVVSKYERRMRWLQGWLGWWLFTLGAVAGFLVGLAFR